VFVFFISSLPIFFLFLFPLFPKSHHLIQRPPWRCISTPGPRPPSRFRFYFSVCAILSIRSRLCHNIYGICDAADQVANASWTQNNNTICRPSRCLSHSWECLQSRLSGASGSLFRGLLSQETHSQRGSAAPFSLPWS
jgi:hypothetical protein